MPLYNPVVWQDGMFMKPQHFQQLDRSQTKLASMLNANASPLHWGIKLLEINTQPGMTGTSLVPEQAAYCGISMVELVSVLLEAAQCD